MIRRCDSRLVALSQFKWLRFRQGFGRMPACQNRIAIAMSNAVRYDLPRRRDAVRSSALSVMESVPLADPVAHFNAQLTVHERHNR